MFVENNLRKAEFDTLKSLMRNKELIIQKADMGNTVVLLNRKDYISKMKLIFADTLKFKKTQIDGSKVLNHLIQMENNIVELLIKLKEKKKTEKLLIKYRMNYTLRVQHQVFYTVNSLKYCWWVSTFLSSIISYRNSYL